MLKTSYNMNENSNVGNEEWFADRSNPTRFGYEDDRNMNFGYILR